MRRALLVLLASTACGKEVTGLEEALRIAKPAASTDVPAPPKGPVEAPPPPDMPVTMDPPAADPEPCTYPESDGVIRLGGVMPAIRWDAAYTADGDTRAFSLEDVYCGRDLAGRSTIAFVVGAGWCPNCPDYIRYVNSTAQAIEAAGGFVVYVEAQDADFNPADSRDAQRYVSRLIGGGPGLRAGDADVLPNAQIFYDSPEVVGVPDAIVVRTSDMRVISTQGRAEEVLDFAAIAAKPGEDWSTGFLFTNRCADGDEEEGEPNDNVLFATPLTPGVHRGGVCNPYPDHYRIREQGNWRVTLEHDGAVGDLDVVVYDPSTRDALEIDGKVVGATGDGDVETFTHHGPAILVVYGADHASGAYRLTLETL